MNEMLITNYLIIVLLVLFCIQILTFLKLIQIIKQINKFLFEFRILIKHGSITRKAFNALFQKNSCQYCIHRMTFIQITENNVSDNFYYKCKKRDIEIKLTDSCNKFQRDFSIQ